jgi:hypothetical protein
MSGVNGDKSRFNRYRKKKIARRARNQERLMNSTPQQKSGVSGTERERKEGSA